MSEAAWTFWPKSEKVNLPRPAAVGASLAVEAATLGRVTVARARSAGLVFLRVGRRHGLVVYIELSVGFSESPLKRRL